MDASHKSWWNNFEDFQMNAQLKNRIYHVRKEINHLKQLKKYSIVSEKGNSLFIVYRVLCNRLHYHDAIQMDTTLEIPDNDCVVGKSNSTWHKSAGQKRRRQSDFHGKREVEYQNTFCLLTNKSRSSIFCTNSFYNYEDEEFPTAKFFDLNRLPLMFDVFNENFDWTIGHYIFGTPKHFFRRKNDGILKLFMGPKVHWDP